jgi:protein-disulfide isomerase
MGFLGVLALLIAIVFVAIIGMKLVPAYIEYFTIKKAVTAITQSGELRNATVADVRRAYDSRANIDDITAVRPGDLEITKDGNEIVVGFAYQKKIPLFYNISMLIDFAGSSKPTSTKSAD